MCASYQDCVCVCVCVIGVCVRNVFAWVRIEA